MHSFFAALDHAWIAWNLKGFVLFSFALQCILILGASLRIKCSNRMVHRIIWLVYLMADWAAYYAIGLIVIPPHTKEARNYTSEMHAFWAPFLLFHIGGPTTIAGFSLEDNDLWDRSVLHLIVQAGATGVVIYRSLPGNGILGATLLMFVAALTRYGGRIWALCTASRRSGHTTKIWRKLVRNVPDLSRDESSPLDALSIVVRSYNHFLLNMGVFYGLSARPNFGFIDANIDPKLIFTLMEIQLGFAYDLYYTKNWTIIVSKRGLILHLVSLMSEQIALVLWALADKRGYGTSEIRITNTLLVGGVVVDVVSILKLALFSDLMACHIIRCFPTLTPILGKLHWFKKAKKELFLFRRWSGGINQLDLKRVFMNRNRRLCVDISILRWMGEKVIGSFTWIDMEVQTIDLDEPLRDDTLKWMRYRFIYHVSNEHELTLKNTKLGEYATSRYPGLGEFQRILDQVGFIDGFLIFYFLINELNLDSTESALKISRYLSYLLFRQPEMLDGVVLDMTLEDITLYLDSFRIIDLNDDYNLFHYPPVLNRELGIDTLLTEHGSDSVLDTIYRAKVVVLLARRMLVIFQNHIELDSRAAVMREFMFEFLMHVAIHCKVRTHIQQLGKGGSFVTLVWLYMKLVGPSTIPI